MNTRQNLLKHTPIISLNSTETSRPLRAWHTLFPLRPVSVPVRSELVHPPARAGSGGPSPPGACRWEQRRAPTGVPEAPGPPGKRWQKAQWQELSPSWRDSGAETTLPRGTTPDPLSVTVSSFGKDAAQGAEPGAELRLPRQLALSPYSSCKTRHQTRPRAEVHESTEAGPAVGGAVAEETNGRVGRGSRAKRPPRKKPSNEVKMKGLTCGRNWEKKRCSMGLGASRRRRVGGGWGKGERPAT